MTLTTSSHADVDTAILTALPGALAQPAAEPGQIVGIVRQPSRRSETGVAESPDLFGAGAGLAGVRALARVLVVSGTAVLAVLCGLVATGATRVFDLSAATMIYRSDRLVDGIGRFTELPGQRAYGYAATLIGLWLWRRRRKDWRPLATAVLAFSLVNIVVGGGKIFGDRPSPRRGGGGSLGLGFDGQLGGFPSGHAANIAVMASVVILVTMGRLAPQAWRRIVLAGVGTVAMVCFTSWIRATHWTTDLAAGLAAGAMCGGVAFLLVYSSLPRTALTWWRRLREAFRDALRRARRQALPQTGLPALPRVALGTARGLWQHGVRYGTYLLGGRLPRIIDLRD